MGKPIDQELQSSFKNEHQRMMLNILYTADLFEQKLSAVFKEYGLTHPQYNILRILNGSHPKALYVHEIKERIMFKNSDLTRLMDRLVKKEFIIRETCPTNRRRVEVSITKAGIGILKALEPEIEKVFDYENLQSKITTEQASAFSRVLDLIRP